MLQGREGRGPTQRGTVQPRVEKLHVGGRDKTTWLAGPDKQRNAVMVALGETTGPLPIGDVAIYGSGELGRHLKKATGRRDRLEQQCRLDAHDEWYCLYYHSAAASISKIVDSMRNNPRSVRFNDLFKVCEHYFGPARSSGTSHAVFRTPWAGDPRVNIQNDHGKAKEYRVRQVLAAIAKTEAE